MKKKDEKKIINLPKKNSTKKSEKKFKRISLEIQKTDIYFMQLDIPLNDNSNEMSQAIKLAWNIVNNDKENNEKFRIGDGFKNRIVKTELVEYIPE